MPTHSQNQTRTVMDALRRIVRDLRLVSREAERVAGISGAQLFVLQALAAGDATSLNDLAARTVTDQSSVSVVVKRLVEAKLVARKASEEDGRRIVLSLTPAGRKLLSRCPEPTQNRIVKALGRLRANEFSDLTRGLSALVREMGIGHEPAALFLEETPASRRATRKGRPRRKAAAA
jgi:DNA-binding MarR family transcriptional regulator